MDQEDESVYEYGMEDNTIGNDDLVALKDNKQLPSVEKHKWIADTGATSHMTGDRKLFVEFRRLQTNRNVRTGGGRLDITGVGTVKLIDAQHSRINLVNVLYVPELTVNLLSARALCSHGMKGYLTEHGITFHHNREKGRT
jgi:hypothetical protein